MFSIKETVAKKYWGHCRRVEEFNQTGRRKHTEDSSQSWMLRKVFRFQLMFRSLLVDESR